MTPTIPIISSLSQLLRGAPSNRFVAIYDSVTKEWIARALTAADFPSVVSGDAHLAFEQAVAANVWTCVHNLNKYPAVQCFEDLGSSGLVEVTGRVEHLDVNTVRVLFNGAMSGWIILN